MNVAYTHLIVHFLVEVRLNSQILASTFRNKKEYRKSRNSF